MYGQYGVGVLLIIGETPRSQTRFKGEAGPRGVGVSTTEWREDRGPHLRLAQVPELNPALVLVTTHKLNYK